MTNKRLLVLMFICLLIFFSITFLSLFNDGFTLDDLVMTWVSASISPLLIEFMSWITKIGSGETIVLLTIAMTGFLIIKKDWFHSIYLIVLIVGGIVFNLLLKIGFQRERPGEMSNIEVFGYSFELASYSFPSGHTMRTVLLFSFFIYLTYLYVKKPGWKILFYFICIFIIIGVSASRVILGEHFPSDILAAVSISFVWFILCHFGMIKLNLSFR
ncbi:phosphatase PAP2 family protein [Evansella sp. AB-P1]|uniref:phosphatase PAP2 family protein n=1 Tax=Evansella sp. AB-P1 TaxID=3037653 RepID=UPI00241F2BF4|nr:phosphatase PAP2 family protein [Evansella sp. AB-P1]MDG5788035.1 phosphatase PAP2 family protein [Evansella sp. AB-P1]